MFDANEVINGLYGFVYDENGKLVAKTALKQCKYASRVWTK